jgi:predicted small lipoprotein YifL
MWLKTCLFIMLAFAMSLQGCGRKGPLTLPVAPVQKSAAPAAVPSISAASSVPAASPAK